MPIKFLDLFQDTWNFVRNRPQFAVSATLLLAVLQLVISQLMPPLQVASEQVNKTPEQIAELLAAQMPPMVVSTLVLMFVNVLLVLNVKSINNGEYRHFFQHMSEALQRFLIAALFTFIQMLPLSFGATFMLSLGSEGTLIALPLMITGLYVFVKLNLVIYAYLIEPKQPLMQTLKFTWGMSRGKMLPLVLFSALIFIIPNLLGNLVSGVNLAVGGGVGMVISQISNAFINLLLVIFSFRFYQVYRDFRGA